MKLEDVNENNVIEYLGEIGVEYNPTKRYWTQHNKKAGDGRVTSVISLLPGDMVQAATIVLPLLIRIESGDIKWPEDNKEKLSTWALLYNEFSAHIASNPFRRLLIDGNKTLAVCKAREKNTIEVEVAYDIERAHELFLQALCKMNSLKYDHKDAIELLRYWKMRQDGTPVKVKYVAEPSDEPTYTHKLIPPVEPMENRDSIPAWSEFLDRCSDPEAFAAWVWSVYETKHRGKQLLYLQGLEGDDGKSRVAETIMEQFGDGAASGTTSNFASQDRFSMSGFVGKRLIVIPDVRNENLLRYDNIKRITGRDRVQVEYKNQRQFTTLIDARILAVSNYPLQVNNASYERSRALIVDVKRSPTLTYDWEDNLQAEFPEFLRWCKWAYSQRCADHRVIQSEASNAMIDDAMEAEQEDMLLRLGCIEMAPNHFLTRKQFSKAMKDCGLSNKEINNIKRTFADAGCKDMLSPNGYQKRIGGEKTKIYRGITFTEEFRTMETNLQIMEPDETPNNRSETVEDRRKPASTLPITTITTGTERNRTKIEEGEKRITQNYKGVNSPVPSGSGSTLTNTDPELDALFGRMK